jgi:hypothetical protein
MSFLTLPAVSVPAVPKKRSVIEYKNKPGRAWKLFGVGNIVRNRSPRDIIIVNTLLNIDGSS